jgi:hypothetical protein
MFYQYHRSIVRIHPCDSIQYELVLWAWFRVRARTRCLFLAEGGIFRLWYTLLAGFSIHLSIYVQVFMD